MTKVKGILKKDEGPSRSVEALDLCWGNIDVYTFPNILGDNPSATSGAPITIGWKHESQDVVGVDHYEYLKRSRPKRSRRGLVMSGAERDTYLLGQGYNLQQLLDAADETSKIRKSREASMKGRFETFKKVFSLATKPVARIVAAKSG